MKQWIVADIEAGHLSLREANREAHANITLVHKWLEEYGRYQPKRDAVEVVMKSEQERIAALKQALAESHLKPRVYESLIAEANRHYKTDLKNALVRRRPRLLCGRRRRRAPPRRTSLRPPRAFPRRLLQAPWTARPRPGGARAVIHIDGKSYRLRELGALLSPTKEGPRAESPRSS